MNRKIVISALCLLCAVHLPAAAHVLNQYLQVAQIVLAPDGVRIELRLIPGIQVAEKICAKIDLDHDGRISGMEELAYAQRVLQDTELAINDVKTPLTLNEFQFPTQQEMREGLGTIRLTLAAATTLGSGNQQKKFFRNNHFPELGVYLVNALVPTKNDISISGQERDSLQREMRLSFDVTSANKSWIGVLRFCLCLALLIPQWKYLRRFLHWQWFRALLVLAVGVASQQTFAHQQPVTLVVLEVAPKNVAMTLHVPLNELELAFGNDVTQSPEKNLPEWRNQFSQYLTKHIHLTTAQQPWILEVKGMVVTPAEQIESGPFQEITVQLLLTPPVNISPRKFTLNYDLIMHQVVTHKALVSIKNDWERGQISEQSVGVIQVTTQTTQIEPLEINLESGSWWDGFKGMVSLGMHHIKEGTDHLLFLLVLLLPVTLLLKGRQWGGFGGSQYSLSRLFKIVTAFTVGHSVTLLAGALGWLRLPQQPVEVLIAFSILVSAVHAIRPIFPGKEMYVSAGFGLVHGLAFATILADLNLSAAPMVLSILGFNLGIEVMQLFVIAITVPWLILLSLTPFYKWVRITSALLAAIASLGWFANRVSGKPNIIDHSMQAFVQYSPLAILLLALIAIPAYFYTSINRMKYFSSNGKMKNEEQ